MSSAHEALGSFSFDVTGRILEELYEIGAVRRTNLATIAGMNYNACIRYLKMIKALGWVDITRDGEVMITPLGNEIRQRLLGLTSSSSSFPPSPVHAPAVLSPEYANNNNMDTRTGSVQGEKKKWSDGTPDSSAFTASNEAKPYGESGSSSESSSSSTTTHVTTATAAALSPSRSRKKGRSEKKVGKQNVMIVDDDAEVAITYEAFLASTGLYSVKTFTQSYEALREFASRKKQYDLVILDIRMPNINGLQLYQSLNAMDPTCKFVFVSSLEAAGELLSVVPGIEKENLLKKPVEKQRFIEAVGRLASSLSPQPPPS